MSTATHSKTVMLPTEYRQTILALRRPRNWDGEGADPITAEACRAALAFVERVEAAQPGSGLPRPAPSVTGSISLYWDRGTEGLLVEISSSGLSNVGFHWEGLCGQYEEGVEQCDAVLGRVVDFLSAPRTDE